MKMKLIFCEKKARKPLVSLEKNIAEHCSSAMMSLHYKKDRVSIGAKGFPDFRKNRKIFIFRHISGHFRTTETLGTTILHVFDVRFFLPF